MKTPKQKYKVIPGPKLFVVTREIESDLSTEPSGSGSRKTLSSKGHVSDSGKENRSHGDEEAGSTKKVKDKKKDNTKEKK